MGWLIWTAALALLGMLALVAFSRAAHRNDKTDAGEYDRRSKPREPLDLDTERL